MLMRSPWAAKPSRCALVGDNWRESAYPPRLAPSVRGIGVENHTMTSETRPHRRSLWALDWLNVFVADVKTGVGPYLAIYLQASHHWNPAHIGLAMAAMGIASVAAQTPV